MRNLNLQESSQRWAFVLNAEYYFSKLVPLLEHKSLFSQNSKSHKMASTQVYQLWRDRYNVRVQFAAGRLRKLNNHFRKHGRYAENTSVLRRPSEV